MSIVVSRFKRRSPRSRNAKRIGGGARHPSLFLHCTVGSLLGGYVNDLATRPTSVSMYVASLRCCVNPRRALFLGIRHVIGFRFPSVGTRSKSEVREVLFCLDRWYWYVFTRRYNNNIIEVQSTRKEENRNCVVASFSVVVSSENQNTIISPCRSIANQTLLRVSLSLFLQQHLLLYQQSVSP